MSKIIKHLSYSIMLIFLSGCVSGHRVVLTSENVVFDHFNTDASMGIMVISDERKGQAWYKTQQTWRVETIQNVPETASHHVWQIEISPGDAYLAVLSEGEGHPVVEIFEIKSILMQRDGCEDTMIAPVLSIDPYPGTIWIERWKSDTLLLVSSDVPLTLLDKNTRRVPLQDPESDSRKFLWDISTDTISKHVFNDTQRIYPQ